MNKTLAAKIFGVKKTIRFRLIFGVLGYIRFGSRGGVTIDHPATTDFPTSSFGSCIFFEFFFLSISSAIASENISKKRAGRTKFMPSKLVIFYVNYITFSFHSEFGRTKS